jgi:hypothetical protein
VPTAFRDKGKLRGYAMEAIISWPFQVFLSICGIIAAWFMHKGPVNFIMVQMAVAILLIAMIVLIATYWRYLIIPFVRSH